MFSIAISLDEKGFISSYSTVVTGSSDISFRLSVEHRPGTTMSHVDALSRNPVMVQHIEEKDLIDVLQEGDEKVQALITNLRLEQEAHKHK